MVRGIEGIVQPSQLELGRFYLDPGYGRGSTLFQWVRTGEMREGSAVEAMLVFSNSQPQPKNTPLYLQQPEGYRPLVKMPAVSVRVDPPSASGTVTTQSLNSRMLVIDGQTPVLMAAKGLFGSVAVDLATGRVCQLSNNWVIFSRWSLVVDEAGEEICIASFDGAAERT